MFDELAAAVEALDVPLDEGALRSLLAVHDRLSAKVALAVGRFDAAGLWGVGGAMSMKAWLRAEGYVGADGHRLAVLGQRLVQLPLLAAAWAEGELSNGQVRVVMAQLTDANTAMFAMAEHAFVPSLVGLSVEDTNRFMTEWRARADAEADVEPDEPELSLCHSATFEGRFVTNGSFDADTGSVVATALAAADSGDLGAPAAQRRAEALVDVCRFFLDHHRLDLPPRRRPQVTLLVEAADVGAGELVDFGLPLRSAAVSRYLCDCSISRAVAERVAGTTSRILDLGRSTDVVSAAQRTALAVRDRHCRYPGCDRPASWCDAHHVRWWTNGGPTDLANLVLLCRRHHTLLHAKRGFEAKLLPDATLEITDPRGFTRSTRPPGRMRSLPLVA